MNHHAKRLIKDLEAMGFRRDHDAKTPARAYRHTNQPDTIVKVFDHMTDSTITITRRMAEKIAGLSSTGSAPSLAIKERARISRKAAKAQRDAEAAAANKRAAKAEIAYQERQQVIALDRERHAIAALMQPQYGRGGPAEVSNG